MVNLESCCMTEVIDTPPSIHAFIPAAQVTEDMLITHFLIQPDPEGVKLQGWNERPFSEAINFTNITDYKLTD